MHEYETRKWKWAVRVAVSDTVVKRAGRWRWDSRWESNLTARFAYNCSEFHQHSWCVPLLVRALNALKNPSLTITAFLVNCALLLYPLAFSTLNSSVNENNYMKLYAILSIVSSWSMQIEVVCLREGNDLCFPQDVINHHRLYPSYEV